MLKLYTAPTQEPWDLADVKNHLVVSGNDQDFILEAYLAAAREYVERITGRALFTQTWDLALDRFPGWSLPCFVGCGPYPPVQIPTSHVDEPYISSVRGDHLIRIPKVPLQTITSFSYVDANGTTQTLTLNTDYNVDAISEPARLTPAYGKSWPCARWQANAVTIRFVAGATKQEDIPSPLRHGILLLIGHWFEHREAVVDGRAPESIPMGVDALISPYRVWA